LFRIIVTYPSNDIKKKPLTSPLSIFACILGGTETICGIIFIHSIWKNGGENSGEKLKYLWICWCVILPLLRLIPLLYILRKPETSKNPVNENEEVLLSVAARDNQED